MVPQLKQLVPTAQFVGPITYHSDPIYLQNFMHQARPRPDAVSWHAYSCMASDPDTCCLLQIES